MDLTPIGALKLPEWAVAVLVVWSLIWKGFSLWRAAKQAQRNWFIAILVLNTAGILEIIYLFIFAPRKVSEKQRK